MWQMSCYRVSVFGPEDSVLGAHQVKLRGFRVELGEIENALSKVAGVQLAVAVVLQDPTGSQRLAAYVTPASVDPAAATADLKRRLPAHMVPDIVMPLERMPLLPNEKVDRRALPAPDWAQAAQAEYVAPASELEARLQAIWHSVLGQDAISTQADFFSVGGNSLQARLPRETNRKRVSTAVCCMREPGGLAGTDAGGCTAGKHGHGQSASVDGRGCARRPAVRQAHHRQPGGRHGRARPAQGRGRWRDPQCRVLNGRPRRRRPLLAEPAAPAAAGQPARHGRRDAPG